MRLAPFWWWGFSCSAGFELRLVVEQLAELREFVPGSVLAFGMHCELGSVRPGVGFYDQFV